MSDAPDRDKDATADPEPDAPEEEAVAAPEPDDAHREAAHLLANEARAELRAKGFDDEQIRRWAEAYVDHERSGDAQRFIAWVDSQQQR